MSLLKLSTDGSLYVVRPRPDEQPEAWLERHLRFCRIKSVVLQDISLLERFTPLSDLSAHYREALDGEANHEP